MFLKVKPVELQRTAGLSQTVHDNLNNYSLPADFGAPIDLYPQAGRTNLDQARRVYSERFDLLKALADKTVSIEGSEGSKFLRIDWKVRTPKTLHNMDTYDGNGTWIAVASATGIATDTIYKYSGGGSVKFNVVATGDGISNVGMSAVDLTDEDELASVIIPIYLPSISGVTSIGIRFGNDITANYWTPTAQTAQADGTAFKVGWNILKFDWSGATETGTVDPTTIDAFRITIASTSALTGVRVDNIQFAIGYPFDLKYYSNFFFTTSGGTYIQTPTADTDILLLDNDSSQIYFLECLKAIAQQSEGEDGVFDINYANAELPKLYQAYTALNPSQVKKAVTSYGGLPRFRR